MDTRHDDAAPVIAGGRLARRALPLVGLCVAVVVVALLLYYLVDVVLLVFAGALLAIIVRALADWPPRQADDLRSEAEKAFGFWPRPVGA